MKAQATTTDTFPQDVLNAIGPVLVDFWAEWCGPCKRLSPILDQLQSDHPDDLTILKLNVDEHPQLSDAYGISGIPAMMLFVNGQIRKSIVGALSGPELEAELADFLPTNPKLGA